MYTLYYKQGACSLAVHALMNELEMDFALEPFQTNGEANPALKAINPRANVPVIEEGDFFQREGGAILAWLCDEYDSEGRFLPKSGQPRAKALEWLMFANATLHPAYSRYFFLKNNADADKAMLLEKATASIQSLWDELEQALEGKDYIAGEISVADILLTVIANWAPVMGIDVSYGPNSKAMFERVSARPAFAKALDSEHVPYKAAA